MIDSLEIINFQSHENTLIQFHPGINAITGESDNGKTSLLRALYLARYNKPSIDSFISKWARNDKGKQKDDLKIVVTKGNNKLTRGKGKELNGYDIDGKILEALGKSGLPQEVETFFNMTEVNIQQQMDTPFLIGQKPADIAKFLNTIVDMTEIDSYLSAVDSKKRANKKDITRVTSEVTDLEKELESYSVLAEVGTIVSKLDKVGNRKSKKKEVLRELTNSISNYQQLTSKSAVWDNIDKIEELLNKVTPIIKNKNDKQEILSKLSKSIRLYNEYKSVLSTVPPIDKIETLLKKVTKIIEEKKELKRKLNSLKDSINSYEVNSRKVEKLDKKIIELKEELPTTCPLCNQPINKEK